MKSIAALFSWIVRYLKWMVLKQPGSDANDLIIVAMTANAVQGEREKCLETGMNDFIAKPVDMRELKRVLNEWVAINPH